MEEAVIAECCLQHPVLWVVRQRALLLGRCLQDACSEEYVAGELSFVRWFVPK